jgi:thiamine biosynthesis lipoprotein
MATDTFVFQALGTQWSVTVDGAVLDEASREAVLGYVRTFEGRFSRFREDSEVNAFRSASAGTYGISETFAELLGRADRLRGLTGGVFDPAAGGLLERAGYDARYRFVPDAGTGGFRLPRWSLDGRSLVLDGPAAFDLGGIGKGYCIDRVAGILRDRGYGFYVVEGGGDMVATSKADGSSYRVAVEWPGRPDTAVGVVELKDRGLAVSDSFRRRWGAWHHIVDPRTREAVRTVVGCAAVAPLAWDADCMTSGLFLASPETYADLAGYFRADYLVFGENGTVRVSADWPGELF